MRLAAVALARPSGDVHLFRLRRIPKMKSLSRTARTTVCRSALLLLLCCSAMLSFSQTDAQLKPNQTFGYGLNQIVKFTYTQSFDCVDQPHDNLNFNGKQAESDPWEFQIPICQVGINPTVDP